MVRIRSVGVELVDVHSPEEVLEYMSTQVGHIQAMSRVAVKEQNTLAMAQALSEWQALGTVITELNHRVNKVDSTPTVMA